MSNRPNKVNQTDYDEGHLAQLTKCDGKYHSDTPFPGEQKTVSAPLFVCEGLPPYDRRLRADSALILPRFDGEGKDISKNTLASS